MFGKRGLKLKILTLLIVGCWSLAVEAGRAQSSPEFLASWRADSYAPSWYQGKVFPARGSKIDVNFELVDNGKIADLLKTKIRWYVNNRLKINEKNGLGIKFYSFINDGFGDEIEVRIAVVGYKGGGELNKIITIPVFGPEAAIDAPYPGRKITAGSNFFRVYPFFFNIKSLSEFSFEWLVNNEPSQKSGEADFLNLNIDSKAPSGFDVSVKAAIKNLADGTAFANREIKAKIK